MLTYTINIVVVVINFVGQQAVAYADLLLKHLISKSKQFYKKLAPTFPLKRSFIHIF